jgi:hypothetical protein
MRGPFVQERSSARLPLTGAIRFSLEWTESSCKSSDTWAIERAVI